MRRRSVYKLENRRKERFNHEFVTGFSGIEEPSVFLYDGKEERRMVRGSLKKKLHSVSEEEHVRSLE